MTDTRAGLAAAWRARPVAVNGVMVEWGIAVETPVEVRVNGEPWTVLLATPEHLDDLAIGLAITEGVLADPQHLTEVRVAAFLNDVQVDLIAPASAFATDAMRARTLVSGTACGLCGIESLTQLAARLPHRVAKAAGVTTHNPPHSTQPTTPYLITDPALVQAFELLAALQPLNQITRTMHAAAWCSPDGQVSLVREDVGRHNALDKLVGALAQTRRLMEPGFIIMTSRCSYELVAKAAWTNAQVLATVSAPTSLALSWSRALGLPVVSTAREGRELRLVRFPSVEDVDDDG